MDLTKNLIALGVFAALTAVPVVAVVRVSRDELRDVGRVVRRALAFDPRHPGLSYPQR